MISLMPSFAIWGKITLIWSTNSVPLASWTSLIRCTNRSLFLSGYSRSRWMTSSTFSKVRPKEMRQTDVRKIFARRMNHKRHIPNASASSYVTKSFSLLCHCFFYCRRRKKRKNLKGWHKAETTKGPSFPRVLLPREMMPSVAAASVELLPKNAC